MDPIARKNAVQTPIVPGAQGTAPKTGTVENKGGNEQPMAPAAERSTVTPQAPTIDSFGVETLVKPDGGVLRKTSSGLRSEESSDGVKNLSLADGGHRFEIDGDTVKTLAGEASGVRLESNPDGMELLSFRDADGHQVRIDPETLIYEVANKRGDTVQVFHADGSQGVFAWGTLRHSDGRHEEYEKLALFDPEGELVRNQGFEGITTDHGKINFDLGEGRASRSLARPLPGQPPLVSERSATSESSLSGAASVPTSLLAEESQEFEPVSTPVAATQAAGTQELDDWDSAQDLVNTILGTTPASNDTKLPPPAQAHSGVVRVTHPDGKVETRLPGGVIFTDDGEKASAVDADGNKLEVTRTEVDSDSGYILTTRNSEGVSYTIAPDHLDMLLQSADGKVHQMVTENGMVDTVVRDGKNIHTHRYNLVLGNSISTPGVSIDPRMPNRLCIASPDNRSYELPFPLPGGPGHGGPLPGQPPSGFPMPGFPMPGFPQPGLPQPGLPPIGGIPYPGYPTPGLPPQCGMRPPFWERVKSVFTGRPPEQAQATSPPTGQMPGSYTENDPAVTKTGSGHETSLVGATNTTNPEMASYPSRVYPHSEAAV